MNGAGRFLPATGGLLDSGGDMPKTTPRKVLTGAAGPRAMIVSYSKNFIFIKTKKTASTTVEAVLGAACSDDDVVTLTTMRAGDVYRANGSFFRHMTAEEAYPLIDPKFWDAAYKITVERHPYEKAVSQAFYKFPKQKTRSIGNMGEYLDRIVREGDYPGFPRWSIGGKVAVDDFIRQENLKADLDRVGARLGIPIPDELPQMKTRTRTDRRPAREILTDAQKAIVYERCAKEFELLGYER
jgi:hypothetical protein